MRVVQIIEGKKQCSKCKRFRFFASFSKSNAVKCGLSPRCKDCVNANYKNNKERYAKKDQSLALRGNYLKNYYNISPEEYLALIEKQNNLCAICHNPEISKGKNSNKTRVLSVDHCHETGKVRGLLCNKCNHMLGQAKDDIEILKSAIDYLNTNK